MKKVLVLSAMMLTAVVGMAKDFKTLVVTTVPQMHCESCENKIKGNLRFEKGVKQIECDIPKQMVTITYDGEKTTPEKLIQSLASLAIRLRKVKSKILSQRKTSK